MSSQDLRHLDNAAPRVMVVDGSKLVRKMIGDMLVREVADAELVDVRKELDVVCAPYLLREGQRPSETESVVFGVAAIVLLLLAAGLYGAVENGRRAEAEADPSVAEA